MRAPYHGADGPRGRDWLGGISLVGRKLVGWGRAGSRGEALRLSGVCLERAAQKIKARGGPPGKLVHLGRLLQSRGRLGHPACGPDP